MINLKVFYETCFDKQKRIIYFSGCSKENKLNNMKVFKIFGTLALITVLSFTANAQKKYKGDADIAFNGGKQY